MITLPKKLVEIGDEAFRGCTAFRDQIAVAPATVTKVGKMAFLDTGLAELRTSDPVFIEEGAAGNG